MQKRSSFSIDLPGKNEDNKKYCGTALMQQNTKYDYFSLNNIAVSKTLQCPEMEGLCRNTTVISTWWNQNV